LIQGLVGVIVEGAVLDQLAKRALALAGALEDRVEARHGVVELLREGRVFGDLARATLTGAPPPARLCSCAQGGIPQSSIATNEITRSQT